MRDLKGNNEDTQPAYKLFQVFPVIKAYFQIALADNRLSGMKYCFSALLIIICICSCSHTGTIESNGAYSTNPAIKEEVEKKISSANNIILGAIDYKLYENDSLVIDSHEKGKSGECLTMASLEGDTISITGFMGMFAGFGYTIELYKDTCVIRHFSKSDAEIYKLNKNDSLQFGVSVPCAAYSLTLAQRPSFTKGEVAEGIIELTSDEYYEVTNGVERKYKMQLKSWFKTQPLESMAASFNKDHEEEINKK